MEPKELGSWLEATCALFLCSPEEAETMYAAVRDTPATFGELLPFWVMAAGSATKGIAWKHISLVFPEILLAIEQGIDPAAIKRFLRDVREGNCSPRTEVFLRHVWASSEG